jgi:hypothetical protein
MDGTERMLNELGVRGLSRPERTFVRRKGSSLWKPVLAARDPSASPATIRQQLLRLTYMSAAAFWGVCFGVVGSAAIIVGVWVDLPAPGVLLGVIAIGTFGAFWARVAQGVHAYPHNVRYPRGSEVRNARSIWTPPATTPELPAQENGSIVDH